MTDAPRAALRAALAERDAAAERVRAAADAAGRARQLLNEAEANLAEFRAVEARVAALHSGVIRAWASAGGARPSLETPAALAAARHERADAEAHTAAIRAAADGLTADLAQAERAAADAAAAIRPAVLDVMASDMDAELARLEAAEAEVQELRNSVASFGATLTLRDPSPPPRLLNALSRGRIMPRFGANETDKAAWTAYAAALATDPDATMPTDTPSVPWVRS